MSTHFSHSQLYNLTNWDTENYINITLVREVCIGGQCKAAGYATFASVQGTPGDGIVMEAEYFGKNAAESTVIVHEMGHYLGLHHTFLGGCKNDNCLQDGDAVCDTPPDNVAGFFPCSANFNSCSTDSGDPSAHNPYRSLALGGLGDQPDMNRNYMDYTPQWCRDQFTTGQRARMQFFIENVRTLLLKSKACLPPCPNKTIAQFTIDQDTIEAGGTVSTANTAVNATGYLWWVNGVPVSQAVDTTFQFSDPGQYPIRLIAFAGSPECDHDTLETTVEVMCPVRAAFDYAILGNQLVFESQSLQADSLHWLVKDGTGKTLYSSTNAADSMPVDSLAYLQLCLLAENAYCDDQTCVYIKLAPDGVEICNNNIDDDADGMVDLFDQNCPCSPSAYQAACPVDCEYLPDSFPAIQMQLKWKTALIADSHSRYQTFVVGDINGDGIVDVLSKKTLGIWKPGGPYDVDNTIAVFDGRNGQTLQDFIFIADTTSYDLSDVAIADVDADGKAEIFSIYFNVIYCFSHDGVLLWTSDPLTNYRGTINIADFNADGKPELYVGTQILNALNGKLLAFGAGSSGCNKFGVAIDGCWIYNTIAADLLPSPGLELAAGNTVYQVSITNPNGSSGNSMTPVVAMGAVTDGFTSVGDIDGDGALDVVVVRDKMYADGGGVWVWNPRTRATMASASAGASGGLAFIGDVTGDCTPEIGMAFSFELRMYQYDGTPQLKLLYKLPTTDESGVTGITMFDFNQDGKNELLYRDETTLRILEGSTGNTLSSWPLKSGTYLEYPIVADVDHDGQAEILINGFQKDSADYRDLRIYCFESAGAPWAPARSVWNQYGYHVTNVNDDLTIPRQPQNQAAVLAGHEDCLLPTCPAPYNAFLTQATYRTQQGCMQWPALDLTIDIIGYECTPDSLIFYLVIDNLGEALLTTDSVFMSCYPIDPIANFETDPLDVTAWYFATDSVTNEIIFTDTIRLSSPIPPGISKMYFTVNDAGLGLDPKYFPFTGIYECSLNNNVDSIDLDISERTLNLGPDIEKCESAVLTLNATSGFETYAWSDGTQDSTYSSPFSGPHFVETTDNCHRVYRDTVQVTINPATDVELGPDLKLCPGEKYQFNIVGDYDYVQWLPASLVDCDSCMTVAVASDTTQSLFVVVGKGNCYSADTVEIQVLNQIVGAVDTIRICAGDSVLVFGNWVSTDAQISQTYTGFSGCDSTQTYVVQTTPLNQATLQYALCAGDSVQVGGAWFSGAGVYQVQVGSLTACDTVFTVSIVENPAVFNTDTLSICTGDSLLVFGNWVSTDAQIIQIYTGFSGCDSTQTYVVQTTPLNQASMQYALCAGDSVQVGGVWFGGAGVYQVQVGSLTACDTVFTVSIVENPAVFNTDTLTICTGDSVLVFSNWVSSNAQISQIYTGFSGCDSTQTYVVQNTPLIQATLQYALCAGDSVQVGAVWFGSAGVYQVQVGSLTACDTVFTVSIVENQAVFNTDTLSICTGDSVLVFGNWLSTDAQISQIYTGFSGCDSTQTYVVQTTPLIQATLQYALCAGDSVQVGGAWLSGAGVYQVQVGSLTACDTVFTVSIIENPAAFNSDTLTICTGDSVLVFGNWISTDAQISQIYTGFSGCDSTQLFCVKFVSLYEESLQFNICSGDSLLFGNQWYTGVGVHRVTVASSTACDTAYTIELIEIPGLFIVDTIRICNNDSIWVNNLWIHAPGLESVAYAGANGCDSVHTTVVLAYETPVSSCETPGGLYIPNVFSPNGDNDNDVWTVIPPKGVLAFDEVYVFDRWGELLAYWQGAPEIGWDGTYKGKLLDAAVFAYFIRYTDVSGQQVEKKGDVTILR